MHLQARIVKLDQLLRAEDEPVAVEPENPVGLQINLLQAALARGMR
jgi:hypothetical protein